MPRISESKYLVTAGWDDAPHLSEKDKKQMWDECLPYLRLARSRGIPALGAGAIYPVSEEDITVKPFEIPTYWPRVYGMDVGWKRTAAVFGAWDRDTDVVYLYSEYYRSQAEPEIHTSAIKARAGTWMQGVIDPASHGGSQIDGRNLLDMYQRLGLNVNPAINSHESGLQSVWSRLSTGRLKVFSSLENWFAEYRVYRRDEKGKIVKDFDHLMDSTRYLCVSGLDYAKCKPVDNKYANATKHSIIGNRAVGY